MRFAVPITLLALCVAPALSRGQAAGVPIEPKRVFAPLPDLNATLTALHDAGRLLSMDAAAATLSHPTPATVTLAPTAKTVMRPPAIAARARQSFLRVGWCFPGPRAGTWNINVADGYVLTPDGVAGTAYHVLRPPRQQHREAYLFAQDTTGKVYPVTQVLTADEQMDVAVFRLGDAAGLIPMGINDQTSPGESVYLLSDPSWVAGYFSIGIIDRFYWDGGKLNGDPMSIDDVRRLRMDVSVDWAPGSSGAALVDECGNVVAHVSKISTITGPASDAAPRQGGPATQAAERPTRGALATYVALHEATPVRGLRLLVEAMNADVTKSATRPTTAPAVNAQ